VVPCQAVVLPRQTANLNVGSQPSQKPAKPHPTHEPPPPPPASAPTWCLAYPSSLSEGEQEPSGPARVPAPQALPPWRAGARAGLRLAAAGGWQGHDPSWACGPEPLPRCRPHRCDQRWPAGIPRVPRKRTASATDAGWKARAKQKGSRTTP
jgi:hypothetical protein